MERHAVWLAALLHDIGKFQQRAEWGSYVSHQELGARWCEEQSYFQQVFGSDLAEAVRHHHNRNFPRSNEQRTRLYQLVQLADQLAAGERETESRPHEAPPQSRLVSIFSRIPLGWQAGDDSKYPPEQRYAVQPLEWESESLLPQQSSASAGDNPYKPLWEAFQQEWQAFAANRTYTEADFRTILALLEKYTSFIPSATPWEREDERTVPDVSLYDHLRVTAAIAACLDRQLLPDKLEQAWADPQAYSEPILLLVKGDLSGIQDFLYLTGRGRRRQRTEGAFRLSAAADRSDCRFRTAPTGAAARVPAACQRWALLLARALQPGRRFATPAYDYQPETAAGVPRRPTGTSGVGAAYDERFAELFRN